MSSPSATASVYLHGFDTSDPPRYNDVMKMNDFPTAPLLEPFTTIFAGATNVQFEWNSSGARYSFLIRDADGSLQAKGDANSHNTTVHSINGMEMLKIVEREVDEANGLIVHTFTVFHKHVVIGTVKVVEKSPPRTSIQITCTNRPQIVVNSLKIGDYAIFRDNLLSTPLCNLQMPNVEIYNPSEFNVKIIFHPQTGITELEQLLCTAAAIAFKTTMKQSTKVVAEQGKCFGYFGGFICSAVFLGLFVLFYFLMEKWGCEHKKAKGFAGYQNTPC